MRQLVALVATCTHSGTTPTLLALRTTCDDGCQDRARERSRATTATTATAGGSTAVAATPTA